ncbi:hypothetical protein BIY23_00400 [Wolbachia pipientis]|uniref:Zinc finger/thioredoxin putative domain-containing protein n=1 Tax=Wolbachia pipientis TaxID=955 RepID=A0A1E7QKF0_WOLPI|nr:zinc-ribbon domain-containing protein [Wolbachia pipientis]OEY86951.1 hypothetical protein BIY23_00400 [Wolbachia pipientis]
MIEIQCQNCTKVYSVPADQIGKSGRTVKCTSCEFIWHANPYKKRGNYLVLTVLICIVICFIAANPNKIKKPYKHFMYKLIGHKKEYNIETNELYQDYLLLPHLKPYNFKNEQLN